MKRHWKQFLSFATALVLAFSMVGCANTDATVKGSSDELADVISDVASDVTATGETYKVGLLSAASGGTAVLYTYIENSVVMAVD